MKKTADLEMLFDGEEARLVLGPEDSSPDLPRKDVSSTMEALRSIDRFTSARGGYADKLLVYLQPAIDHDGSQIFNGRILPGRSGADVESWLNFLGDVGVAAARPRKAAVGSFSMKRVLLFDLVDCLRLGCRKADHSKSTGLC